MTANPYYPQHVEHPAICVPSTWLTYDQKWWPTTQPAPDGKCHALAFSYPLHYISPFQLLSLNKMGKLIEALVGGNNLAQNYALVGAIAVEFLMAGFDEKTLPLHQELPLPPHVVSFSQKTEHIHLTT